MIAAPLLVAQGLSDDLVLPSVQERFVRARCDERQQLEYRIYAGADHVSLVASDARLRDDLVEWTRERFAGAPVEDGCRTISRWQRGKWPRRVCGVRIASMEPTDPRFPSAADYANESVQHPPLAVVDVQAEQRAVKERYRNQVLSRVNASCMRLAVFEGEYRWHHHPRSDELFLVVEGRLEIDLADGRTLALGPWQSIVVPAGALHRTRAIVRTVNLTFEDLGAETVFADEVARDI